MRKKGKTVAYNDYSDKMPDLVFEYDEDFYTDDLPDPQVDPVLVGARIPLRKVGIAPVDLPIVVQRRDGGSQTLQAEASLYCSLDDPNAKGLNLSRLYLLMHEKIKDNLTIEGIRDSLKELAEKQGSKDAYCKLRFKYPWHQDALRSRKDDASGKLSGHIAYKTEIEGQYRDGEYKFYLTVDYVYSSTCPCSFELANDARSKRNAAANAHSQRSIMKVKVEFSPSNVVWIEDLVELCREVIPTEVQIVVKRRDEQAFEALDNWYDQEKVFDFSIAVSHEESLHPWNAIAITSKFDTESSLA